MFEHIVADFKSFASRLQFKSIIAIPVSARYGDNISSHSACTSWYRGPHLLSFLEDVDVEEDIKNRPFRMVVQWVNRPHLDFRGYCGTIVSGRLRAGDQIVIAPSGRMSRVLRIGTADGDLAIAEAGQAVTIILADEVDVSRGDVLSPLRDRPEVSDQFAAQLIWMSEEPLLPGRSYLMKHGARIVPATITELKHRLDVNTLAGHAAKTLSMNEVGVCNLATTSPIAFDSYASNRTTGAFILIDRYSNATVAAGMISFGLRRATNIHHQSVTVTNASRAQLKHQRPAIFMVYGALGRRQIHNRKPGRGELACARRSYHAARR